jgi:hypothetical protein
MVCKEGRRAEDQLTKTVSRTRNIGQRIVFWQTRAVEPQITSMAAALLNAQPHRKTFIEATSGAWLAASRRLGVSEQEPPVS